MRLIKHITLDGRKFTVTLDRDGKPMSIKERRIYANGMHYEAMYNAPVWHHSQAPGSEKTLPSRILGAVKKMGHDLVLTR